jgi:hypothetical protein
MATLLQFDLIVTSVAMAVGAALTLVAPSAAAFTFADGTTSTCVARGEEVHEYRPLAGTEPMAFTGHTVKVGSSYQIVWNAQKLEALPHEVHDYLFFHECAHAQVPTTDEVEANCVGLKNMRAAGRAGFAIETKLAAFYGARNDYWKNTLRCADAGSPSAQTPAHSVQPPAPSVQPPAR